MNETLDSADGELNAFEGATLTSAEERATASARASSSSRPSPLQIAAPTATRAAIMAAMLQQLLIVADSRADELARVAAQEASRLESLGIHLEAASQGLFAGLASTGSAALDQMTMLASLAVAELHVAGEGTHDLATSLSSTLQGLQCVHLRVLVCMRAAPVRFSVSQSIHATSNTHARL